MSIFFVVVLYYVKNGYLYPEVKTHIEAKKWKILCAKCHLLCVLLCSASPESESYKQSSQHSRLLMLLRAHEDLLEGDGEVVVVVVEVAGGARRGRGLGAATCRCSRRGSSACTRGARAPARRRRSRPGTRHTSTRSRTPIPFRTGTPPPLP
jgi:hypothetical protein